MRITNSMMTNNSLANITVNKINTDKWNTQLSTEKKIQRASEDPIIAVRALRFRTQLAEMTQYLDRNIPDAENWLRLTEEALADMQTSMSGALEYITQGANDTLDVAERETIITQLSMYRDGIFESANADDGGGRRLFAGYKTDTDMTFRNADPRVQYDISEEFDVFDFSTVDKIVTPVEVDIAALPAALAGSTVNDPSCDTIHRIRLAYDQLTIVKEDLLATPPVIGTPSFKGFDTIDNDGDSVPDVNITVIKQDATGQYVDIDGNSIADPYSPPTDSIYVLADSGEMLFGDNAYTATKIAMSNANPGDFGIEYRKIGFDKGDLRPEHYFDCTRTTSDGEVVKTEFIEEAQDINYTVNFNQTLKVNSEGKKAFTHDIIRDIDEMLEAVEMVNSIAIKQENVEKMLADPTYGDETSQAKLQEMQKSLSKEYDLAEDRMQKIFERTLGSTQDHFAYVTQEIADLGTRGLRLAMNEERLDSQRITLEDLKSMNEDAELAETAIRLTAAETVYDASLMAASRVISKSLLDFL